MNIYEVLRRPIITEKNTLLMEQNKYTFEVAKSANKKRIKDAVEVAFKVKVVGVNVLNIRGKMRRIGRHQGKTRSWKKAVVTLAEGNDIEIFKGGA